MKITVRAALLCMAGVSFVTSSQRVVVWNVLMSRSRMPEPYFVNLLAGLCGDVSEYLIASRATSCLITFGLPGA